MKSAKIKTQKITLGTKEWADSNVNCYYGCSNDCRYCYAKKMAIRFKRKTKDTWKEMEPNEKMIKKGYAKRKGRVMFPTSHDITEKSLNGCLTVLEKLIDAENEVLITTKPAYDCVKAICDTFADKKHLVQFRFTITSLDNDKLQFWEAEAPSFEERLKSLKYAYQSGFKTSISIEPFLDKDPFRLVEKIKEYVTESIWIGKMNYIKASNIPEQDKLNYKAIRYINSEENLEKVLKHASEYDEEFLRIKDSIYNYLK